MTTKAKKPHPGKFIRLHPTTWNEMRQVSKHNYDMTPGKLVALVIRNFLRHRWALDLIPEPQPLPPAEDTAGD